MPPPGSSPDDFVLASNDLDDGIRAIGFLQQHRGLSVLDGQVSFRFKAARLFVIGSEALPRLDVSPPRKRLDPAAARAVAAGWTLSDRALAAHAAEVEGTFILPIVGATGGVRHHAVVRVTVAAARPVGRWAVYLDADTGAPVAREQTLRFADATFRLNAPVRYPLRERFDYPAQHAELRQGETSVITDEGGRVRWSGDAPASFEARLAGPLVQVVDDGGQNVTAEFALADGDTAVWDASSAPADDAQLNTYVHAMIVKAYARRIAPDMTWLNGRFKATTNLDQECNAYSNGTDIFFFRSSDLCENTGRIADVVYHEFGHSFHNHAIIDGIGYFDKALSEGISDYLAATITGDPGTSRGFFYSDEPLRHIDPPGREFIWPEDISEIHETGRIISGALWDLRKALIDKLGSERGIAHTDHLFYQGIRRAVDIPSMFPEVLAADDDDGDLANGTPNSCEIALAFGAHGIRITQVTLSALGLEPPQLDGYRVTARLSGLFPSCPSDAVRHARVEWRRREDPGAVHVIDMEDGPDGLEANIPPQPTGQVVQYRVRITLAGGQVLTYPDNPADPMYELFVGPVIPLYCTNFDERDPMDEGWTRGRLAGSDDWQWGTPQGGRTSGDPDGAFSGSHAFGNDLGRSASDGSYPQGAANFARSPVVDTGGRKVVRLQYRRWLNVEDGHFDDATIYANGMPVWANLDSSRGAYSSIAHRDREWRFHDVDLSRRIVGGKVDVMFELISDQSTEYGGWTIDDLCIVALPTCGDGTIDAGETCDAGDGNSDTAPDGCRRDCQPARCGDGVVDTGETCDGPDCATADCGRSGGAEGPPLPGIHCACGVASGAGGGLAHAVALAGLSALAGARRRARRSNELVKRPDPCLNARPSCPSRQNASVRSSPAAPSSSPRWRT